MMKQYEGLFVCFRPVVRDVSKTLHITDIYLSKSFIAEWMLGFLKEFFLIFSCILWPEIRTKNLRCNDFFVGNRKSNKKEYLSNSLFRIRWRTILQKLCEHYTFTLVASLRLHIRNGLYFFIYYNFLSR